jgi:ribonuclease P protein component
VLPRAHRITEGVDLRRVSRKGRRRPTAFFTASVLDNSAVPTRFGFIVSKQVGGAVTRNKVKRRLRSLAYSTVLTNPLGSDVVVRALPASASATYDELAEAWRGIFPS